MQNSKSKYILGKYTFYFTGECKTYSCESYSGIIFYDKDHGEYDVVNNRFMGFRLLISNSNGVKDMPFNPATFSFLPDSVSVEEA